MTLALGISDLLIGTIRDNRILLEKGKAWYAAESGLEQAMFEFYNAPPGFETEKEIELNGQNLKYRYLISAAARQIPEKESYEIQLPEDSFASLPLNESVTIPLFNGTKPEDMVKRFRVDYYFAPEIKLAGGFVDDDLDILRVKIFGIAADGTMEVISEFLPADKGNSSLSPTCFGTESACYNAAKFYQRAAAQNGATEFNIIDKFHIEKFLQEHSQNFLVLNNIVNIDLIAGFLSSSDKKKIANIRYRVIEKDDDGISRLTLPYVKILADGFAGETKQSIAAEISREKTLPVFNYALYRTVE
ncbi:hypothetical protein HZC21_01210 [Candidatus Peregrinibacteria bacterium]|nr:hypothetical protein [Candidatus Peregrinibacteria bacterium]